MGDGAAELEPNGDGLLLAGVLEPNGVAVAVAVLEPKGEAPDNGGLPKGDGALEDAPSYECNVVKFRFSITPSILEIEKI